MIVEKFGATIKESRLVFVAFDDELFAAAKPVAAIVEIRDHAADQKIRTPRRNVENPGEHRSGGRLAMRARDDNRSVAADEIILEKLRHRAIGNFFVEDELKF